MKAPPVELLTKWYSSLPTPFHFRCHGVYFKKYKFMEKQKYFCICISTLKLEYVQRTQFYSDVALELAITYSYLSSLNIAICENLELFPIDV